MHYLEEIKMQSIDLHLNAFFLYLSHSLSALYTTQKIGKNNKNKQTNKTPKQAQMDSNNHLPGYK